MRIKGVIVVFGALCMVLGDVYGQTQEWVRRIDGPKHGHDIPFAMTLDNLNNIYITGQAGSLSTWGNFFTIKYDPQGNDLWHSYYPSYHTPDWGCDIAVTDLGEVIATGSVDSNNYNYKTVRYDAAGNILWSRQYDGPRYTDYARSVTLGPDGSCYVTGLSSGIDYYADIATIKYDSLGNEVWVRRYSQVLSRWEEGLWIDIYDDWLYVGGLCGVNDEIDYLVVKYDTAGNELWSVRYDGGFGEDLPRDFTLDSSGNIYITGRSMGENDFGCVTVKYDKEGKMLWERRYDDPGWDEGVAISLYRDRVYIAGISYTPIAGNDYLLIAYDTLGHQEWVSKYDRGDDQVSAMAVDKNGVYLTGASKDSSYDFLTVKFDHGGNYRWSATYDGPAHDDDKAVDIVVDDSANLYVTGWSYDPGTSHDIVTIKYSQEIGVEENRKSALKKPLVEISPNPFRDKTNIRLKIEDERWKIEEFSLRIYDVTGRLIKDFDLTSGAWDGRDNSGWNLPAGVYFLTVQKGEIKQSIRLVKVR